MQNVAVFYDCGLPIKRFLSAVVKIHEDFNGINVGWNSMLRSVC